MTSGISGPAEGRWRVRKSSFLLSALLDFRTSQDDFMLFFFKIKNREAQAGKAD